MGGQSSGNQTVRNVTEVDPITQAWRGNIMQAGGSLYNQGVPAYYPGQTVVPFSNQTQGGLDYLQNYALQGAPNLGAANAASTRAMSGWNPAMPYANSFASGNNPLMQNLLGASQQGVAGQVAPMVQGSMGANPLMGAVAQAGTTRTGMGVPQLQSFANAENPYLDSLFNQGVEQVSNAVNANFARAGRFGANAAHTGALGREIGGLYNQIYAPAYEASQNRALQAAGQLSGIDQGDRAAALQGLGQAAGLYEAGAGRGLAGSELMGSLFAGDASRQLSGASQAAQMGLSGADLLGGMWSQGNQDAARAQALLPSLYSYGMMPGQSLLDVGGMYEGLAGDYLNDDRARYDYAANAPWDYLGRYSQLMSGLPDFSSQTSTTTGPRPNRLMQGLGAAASLGSLFSGGLFGGSLFGAKSIFG